MLGDVNKLFVFKSLLTTPRNVLPLHLKQTFPPIIWILTEGEGDGIEPRLPFKMFSTHIATWNIIKAMYFDPMPDAVKTAWKSKWVARSNASHLKVILNLSRIQYSKVILKSSQISL